MKSEARSQGKSIRCAACSSECCDLVISLGSVPPVNSFPLESMIDAEVSFPLDLYFCSGCGLLQLSPPVEPAILYRNYLHTSSASAGNVSHLKSVAALLVKRHRLNGQSRVLEIGANDGTLLELLGEHAGTVLGIDPAENLHRDAIRRGLPMVCGFFSEKMASTFVETHGQFDVIVGLNVVAHTADFLSLLKGVRRLLTPEGVFMMECAYVVDTILKGQFDTIYHEHVYNFSCTSICAALSLAGMEARNVEVIPSQGGSLRLTVTLPGSTSIAADGSLARLLQQEGDSGFLEISSYLKAKKLTEEFRASFRSEIEKFRRDYSKVIGVGAPARGVVILNYCGIGTSEIDFIVDDTVLKQGRVTPAGHIPVRSWESLDTADTTAFVLLSWNYRESLVARLKKLGASGKVLIPFPTIQTLNLS